MCIRILVFISHLIVIYFCFQVGVSKSLPDFLADGAVRTQNNNNGTSASQSPEWELDRVRQELDMCRRQLSEQVHRADNLQRELEIARNKEHEYTQNLAKTLEQVEDNLERSNVSKCDIREMYY